MHRDREGCVRAVHARDARFDGWFFTAVTSTRIYCRPSCPVLPPKVENMTFYPSAAAAQQAGFRACKRCRPDTSPGSPQWDERADSVARAMRLISDGVIDREGVRGLAAHLGYSVRQVERQVSAELGAGPLALARAQRAQTARVMIETTGMPMAEVAMASGFSSIRSFNETVRAVFGLTPSAMRARSAVRDATTAPGEVSLRLPVRRPLDARTLFAALAADAVPGVEEWREGFRRTLRLPRGHGVVTLVPPEGDGTHVSCRLALTDFRDLTSAINRCRRLLDLDADPVAVVGHLATDPVLAPLVRGAPGRRVPRTVDAGELAVRTLLAPDAVAVLVATHGEPVDDAAGGLTRLFPTAATLAADAALPPPAAALVRALADGVLHLHPGADRAATRAALHALPGIGSAEVETILARGLGDPDAFAAEHPRAADGARALGLDPSALAERSRAWSPWRAYAAEYLSYAMEVTS